MEAYIYRDDSQNPPLPVRFPEKLPFHPDHGGLIALEQGTAVAPVTPAVLERRSWWKRYLLWIVLLILSVVIAVVGGTVGAVLGERKNSSTPAGDGYSCSLILFDLR
jgi:hypothetical protein